MTRSFKILLALLLTVTVLVTDTQAAEPERAKQPNVVLIMCDDKYYEIV